jgi:hypothetical protein
MATPKQQVEISTAGVVSEEVLTDPVKRIEKGKHGGFRPGLGRPKGSTTIYSKDSVKKLQELNFDPIEKLVEHYYTTQTMIDDMKAGKTRWSAMALSNYMNIQSGIMNTLMKYGYRAVPEKTEQVIEDKKPLKIVLTSE